MHKVIDEWNAAKDYFILTLNEEIPHRPFWKYRIDGKEYDPVPHHMNGPIEVQLKNICIRAPKGSTFVGKEVEFV